MVSDWLIGWRGALAREGKERDSVIKRQNAMFFWHRMGRGNPVRNSRLGFVTNIP